MTNKCLRGGVLLLTLLLGLCLCGIALAEGKTLTVCPGGEYDTIQKAIDYIDTQADKTGWTITVEAGTYGRFTVLAGLDNLTIRGNGVVTVSVLDDSAAPAEGSGGYPETCGVCIRPADGVTLEGLRFVAKKHISEPWYAAMVSTYTQTGAGANHLTVRNCSFTGVSSTKGYGLFINNKTNAFTAEGCTFDKLGEGISMYGDGTSVDSINVKNNAFTNCSFAIHGYWGGKAPAGTLAFTGNSVTGSEALRSKIVLMDQFNTGAMKAKVQNNTLNNAIVGLVNLREAGEANDVLAQNTFSGNSHFVEAEEPGSIDFYTVYEAPANGYGHWEIADTGTMSAENLAYIRAEIAKANAAGEKRLSFTTREGELIQTFTGFKDALYWVSESAPVPSEAPAAVPTPPQTGDASTPALWLVLTALSAAAMLTLALRRRRA